jgi:hypothetical protein
VPAKCCAISFVGNFAQKCKAYVLESFKVISLELCVTGDFLNII